jgi:PKD domain/Bacterial Ig-like domain (group 1)
MTRHLHPNRRLGKLLHFGLAGLLLGAAACGLDEVDIPDFSGPSEYGLAVVLQAIPDVLTADGRNRAQIVATVRDQNGQPASGRQIFFAIADESGNFADLGSLSEETVTTDGNGAARTIYTTPPRPDATADQTVLVLARPVGDNANAAFYRQVRIELRSAEPRLFPQNPLNTPPNCSFIIEPAVGPYRVNTSVLFQTTSSDVDGTIVRYAWTFGDGTTSDQPDEEHHYGAAGTYVVEHGVTDDDGGQSTCPQTVVVVN